MKRYRKPTRPKSPKAVIRDLRAQVKTSEQAAVRTQAIADAHWQKFTRADSYRAAAESRVRELEARLESLCPPIKDDLRVTTFPDSYEQMRPAVVTADLTPIRLEVQISMRRWQCHDRYNRAALKAQCMDHILREVRQRLDTHFLLNGNP